MTSRDRTDKLTVYAEYVVRHCWYVDPIARTLEVFALVDDRGNLSVSGAPAGAGAVSAPEAPSKKWLLAAAFKDADPVTAPPFEVHTFPLDVLWVADQPGHRD